MEELLSFPCGVATAHTAATELSKHTIPTARGMTFTTTTHGGIFGYASGKAVHLWKTHKFTSSASSSAPGAIGPAHTNCARVRSLTGPKATITGVACDGYAVAAACADGHVFLWKLETGELLSSVKLGDVEGKPFIPTTIAASEQVPYKLFIGGAADGNVAQIWLYGEGKLLSHSLGKFEVDASVSGTAGAPSEHQHITACAFSAAQPKHVLVASSCGGLFLYDIDAHTVTTSIDLAKSLSTTIAHAQAAAKSGDFECEDYSDRAVRVISDVAFNPHSASIACVTFSIGVAAVIDATTGTVLELYDPSCAGAAGSILGCAWNAGTSRSFFTVDGSTSTVCEWAATPTSSAASGLGSLAAVSKDPTTPTAFASAPPRRIAVDVAAIAGFTSSFSHAPQSMRFTSITWVRSAHDNEPSLSSSAAQHPRHLLITTSTGHAVLFNAVTHAVDAVTGPWSQSGAVTDCKSAKFDANIIVSSSTDGTVALTDVSTMEVKKSIAVSKSQDMSGSTTVSTAQRAAVTALALDPAPTTVDSLGIAAGTADGSLVVFAPPPAGASVSLPPSGERCRSTALFSNAVIGADWSPQWMSPAAGAATDKVDFIAACGAEDKHSHVVKASNGQKIWTFEHPAAVTAVLFHATKVGILATACADNTIRLFNIFGPAAPIALLKSHTASVSSIVWNAFQPGMLLSGSEDKTACVWDCTAVLDSALATAPNPTTLPSDVLATEVLPVRRLEGHTDRVTAVQWCSMVPFIAVTMSAGCTKVWDTRACVAKHEVSSGHAHANGADATALTTHPNRPTIFTSCGNDGVVRVWYLSCLNYLHMNAAIGQLHLNIKKPGDLAASTALAHPGGCGDAIWGLQVAIAGTLNMAERMRLVTEFFDLATAARPLVKLVGFTANPQLVQDEDFGDRDIVVPTDVAVKRITAAADTAKTTAAALPSSNKVDKAQALVVAAEKLLVTGHVKDACDLFVEAGDVNRAIAAAPAVGIDFWRATVTKAAATAASNGNVRKAADLYILAGDGAKAAAVLEKGGLHADAIAAVAFTPQAPEAPFASTGSTPTADETKLKVAMPALAAQTARRLLSSHPSQRVATIAAAAALATGKLGAQAILTLVAGGCTEVAHTSLHVLPPPADALNAAFFDSMLKCIREGLWEGAAFCAKCMTATTFASPVTNPDVLRLDQHVAFAVLAALHKRSPLASQKDITSILAEYTGKDKRPTAGTAPAAAEEDPHRARVGTELVKCIIAATDEKLDDADRHGAAVLLEVAQIFANATVQGSAPASSSPLLPQLLWAARIAQYFIAAPSAAQHCQAYQVGAHAAIANGFVSLIGPLLACGHRAAVAAGAATSAVGNAHDTFVQTIKSRGDRAPQIALLCVPFISHTIGAMAPGGAPEETGDPFVHDHFAAAASTPPGEEAGTSHSLLSKSSLRGRSLFTDAIAPALLTIAARRPVRDDDEKNAVPHALTGGHLHLDPSVALAVAAGTASDEEKTKVQAQGAGHENVLGAVTLEDGTTRLPPVEAAMWAVCCGFSPLSTAAAMTVHGVSKK